MGLFSRIEANVARSTNSCRLYAIGDVHGRFDLLAQLFRMIELDQLGRSPLETHVVLLGDYIDRGPDSRAVCELLSSMEDITTFHCLRGNHEQTMLDVLDGSQMAHRFWMKFGGEETLRSWGIDAELIAAANVSEQSEPALIEALRCAVPDRIVAWLRSLPSHYLHGDYLFVHAGVRPRLPLDAQADEDLLWIREPFISSKVKHPWLVVHGHSEADEIELRANRIGVDTGAYRTGILSAVGIESGTHWTIQTPAA